MKKIVICALVLMFATIGYNFSISKKYIETEKSEYINQKLINFIELDFKQNEVEREQLLLGNKLYSSSSYILEVEILAMEGIDNIRLLIESVGNPEEIRVPIFKGFLNAENYKSVIELEENTNYSLDIVYYAVHRYKNNDWNGEIKVTLLYDIEGGSRTVFLGEYTLVEPCVPTEYIVVYERFNAPQINAFMKSGTDYERGGVRTDTLNTVDGI